jgi:NAD(P)-dependent dehydrogenase (short-subunit alcohol dehydrogenase family)
VTSRPAEPGAAGARGLRSLREGYRAAVVGAGGAIGGAVAAALAADPRCAAVVRLGRGTVPPLDFGDEPRVAAAAAHAAEGGPLQLLVIATGALFPGGAPPEKRLAELDASVMAQAFAVNTIGPALVLKHFVPRLARGERVLVGVLSARVGSIGDNGKGGWFSYRASKAALNMVVKTVAIEVARTRPLAVLAALHPGTVASPLSRPVIGDTPATAPADAAANLLAVLDALPAEGASGGFHAWDGRPVPW